MCSTPRRRRGPVPRRCRRRSTSTTVRSAACSAGLSVSSSAHTASSSLRLLTLQSRCGRTESPPARRAPRRCCASRWPGPWSSPMSGAIRRAPRPTGFHWSGSEPRSCRIARSAKRGSSWFSTVLSWMKTAALGPGQLAITVPRSHSWCDRGGGDTSCRRSHRRLPGVRTIGDRSWSLSRRSCQCPNRTEPKPSPSWRVGSPNCSMTMTSAPRLKTGLAGTIGVTVRKVRTPAGLLVLRKQDVSAGRCIFR